MIIISSSIIILAFCFIYLFIDYFILFFFENISLTCWVLYPVTSCGLMVLGS